MRSSGSIDPNDPARPAAATVTGSPRGVGAAPIGGIIGTVPRAPCHPLGEAPPAWPAIGAGARMTETASTIDAPGSFPESLPGEPNGVCPPAAYLNVPVRKCSM